MQPNEPRPDNQNFPPAQSADTPQVPPTPASPPDQQQSSVGTAQQAMERPQSLYTNAPDYLGLQPVEANQTQKKPQKLKLLILAVAVALLTGGGIAAMLLLQKPSPEQRFYSALELAMQSSYITRKFEIKTSGQQTPDVITAESDFSNPSKPKTKVMFEYAAGGDDAVVGEAILLEKDNFYGRFAKTPVKSTPLNTWQKISSENTSYNFSELAFIVNNPLDTITLGQFSEGVRNQLIGLVKLNDIYTIEATETVQVNNQEAIRYDVVYSRQKFVTYNEKAAELIGVTSPYVMPKSNDQAIKMQVWVEASTGKILQQSFEETQGESTMTVTVTFSYPDNIAIQEPSVTTGTQERR